MVMATFFAFNNPPIAITIATIIIIQGTFKKLTNNNNPAILGASFIPLANPTAPADKKADYKMIGKIVGSWVLTLPIAALVSALIYVISNNII